jgi:hypothetical protein
MGYNLAPIVVQLPVLVDVSLNCESTQSSVILVVAILPEEPSREQKKRRDLLRKIVIVPAAALIGLAVGEGLSGVSLVSKSGSLGFTGNSFEMNNNQGIDWKDAAGNANAGKLFCDAQNNFHLQLIKSVGLTGSFRESYNGAFWIESNPASPAYIAAFIPPPISSTIGYSFYLVGNGLCTGTAWYYSSDRKLKDNIIQIDHALDKVLQLTGVYFTWKDQKRGLGRQVGFVAQDVQPVLPEVVLDNGKDDLALSYDHMVPLLLEGLKEAVGKIEALTARIKALEARK